MTKKTKKLLNVKSSTSKDCLRFVKASKLNFLWKVRVCYRLERKNYECERGIMMITYSKQLWKILIKLNHLHASYHLAIKCFNIYKKISERIVRHQV